MNIVVIGSCTDSSILAKDLNRRLNSSIVARIDLLKNIKQLVLPSLNIKTTNNLGAYVGDVETFDYSAVSDDTKKKLQEVINSIDASVGSLSNKANINSPLPVSTFDALTNGIPTSTYSFVKVYSGAVKESHINNMFNDRNFVPNAIIVKVKQPKDSIIPITISDSNLKKLQSEAFASIECDKIEDVFKTELFDMLFGLTENKEPAKTETKKEATTVTMVDPFNLADVEEVMEMAA